MFTFRFDTKAAVLTAALLAAAAPVAAQAVYEVGDGDDDTYLFSDEQGGGYLGVRLDEETELAEGGARVTHVVAGSPAAEAGLEEGDVIVEFDGEIIRGPIALTQRIHGHGPGDRVTLRVVRDGKKLTHEVRLGERKMARLAPRADWDADRWTEWQAQIQDRMKDLGERVGGNYSFTVPDVDVGTWALSWGRPKLGVELVETTVELREHLGGDEDEGVLVGKVLDGTPAERSGIRVGDLILSVDGRSVASVGELREALEDKEGTTFAVRIARDGKETSIDVTIPAPERDRPTGPRASVRPAPPAPPAPVAMPALRAPLPPPPPALPTPIV